MSAVSRRQFLASAALVPSAMRACEKTSSPFLQGNYAPVRAEVTADRLEVVGTLPAELDGLFVRNGPNPQFSPRGAYHWFDGDGMLHGVRFRAGRASYRNRYVRTDGWREEHAAGKALYNGLLGLPDLKKVALGQDGYKNAANTALVWYDGKLLALWEGGAPHAVRAPALETAGRYTFGGKLRHACTAHPKIDPTTGELLFFGYQPVTPYLQYSVADARGAIMRTTPIELPRPVMMHDFAVTARHTVFLDLPVVFDFRRLLRGESSFGYDPKLGARIGVLPRHGKGSEVRWFPVAPCYVFHTVNAHDDGDEVVLHGCRMADFPAEIVPPDGLSDRELRRTGSTLYRWRLNLRTGAVREGAIDDTPADFPRIDERRTGRPVRFSYLTTLRWDALLKVDLERGTTERHAFGKGRQGGEGVFVPRPGGTAEDDGWVMTYVYDRATDRSELVVVDAQNVGGPAAARVQLPVRVPFGFHGTWVSGAQLAAG
ncbi:MAG: carotenoid oxygenase family protein [Gemmataceae bacterium]